MSLIDNLENLLAQGQDSALLRYGLGGEYLKLGQHDKAALHLSKAIELDPNYSAAFKLLGQALAAAGRGQEAAETYRKGIAAAERKGDLQAAKEMRVFAKRIGNP